jgi:hypothetical protein
MRLYFKEGKNTEFWAGVKSGSKTHTCRKRAVKIGAALALICGGESVNVTCTGVQRFQTELAPYSVIALVDGKVMAPETVAEFARRSGFKGIDAMFDYYGEDFNGYIIHWGNDFYEGIH